MPLPTARRSRLRCEVLEHRLTPSSAGDLDPSFNGTGINTDTFGPNFTLETVAVAPDGKIVVAGTTKHAGVILDADILVARFLPDGQLDSSFHGNGQTVFSAPDGQVSSLAVQPNGTILVEYIVATAYIADGTPHNPIGQLDRISADGNTVETGKSSLGTAGMVVNPTTGDVYLMNNVGGGFGPSGSPPQIVITRLDKNLDTVGTNTLTVFTGPRVIPAGPSTTYTTYQGDVATGIALDSVGRVYVVSDEPDNQFGLTRLDADLSQSSVKTAIYDAGNQTLISGIAVSRSEQIFVAGTTFTSGNPRGVAQSTTVWRFDGDLNKQAEATLIFIGTTDAANRAGEAGEAAGGRRGSILTDPAGRVLLTGNTPPDGSGNTTFAVARLNPSDLTPDTSFNKTGLRTLSIIEPDVRGVAGAPADAAIDSAGNIVVDGTTPSQTDSPSTPIVFRLLGLDNTPTGPVLVGGSPDGSAVPLAATGGSYQVGTSVPFFPGFAGNVRTAVADINGDGVPDYVGGSGPGGGPRVAVIDGKTGARLADFFAFEPSFTGGVSVAAADINGDGRAEVIATPDQGGGPVVAVFDGAKLTAGQSADGAQLARFLGIDDPAFRGGARPAVGDVSGDGTPDLLVSAGFLGGPRVALYDGRTIASNTPVKLVPDFFAFEDSLRNGAFVAAGDVTGDGHADLAFGGGPGGAPRVRVFDGAKLLAAGGFSNLDAIASAAQVANFFAGDTSSRGGVRLAMRDADGDGKADLITGSGEGEPAAVRVYKGTTLLTSATPTADQTLDPFGGATLADGVFVG